MPESEKDPYTFERYPLLIVVSGPAGVGKDALVKRMRELAYPLHFVVTTTDRPPRPGEVHGEDYFFVSTEEFLRMEQEGELLEQAIVYGQRKGQTKQRVREGLTSGKDVIMRVDVQGAATIRQIAPDAVLIFLAAPSRRILEARLRRRGTDSPEQMALRLSKVDEEMKRLQEFDYVVVNRENKLDQAVAQVGAIMEAEHCRIHPRIVRI